MVAITIDQISKNFGSHVALDRISLEIKAGEIFFLLGPSGCGKTTLLRSIAGFLTPDSGRILFGDQDVTHMPVHKRGTGMMFQSYALWPHLNVAQNVAFGLQEQGVAKAEITKRVAEALASVEMDGLGERRIAELSGGQQQRVALARALVIRPRALLLDEPLSNLDARLRLEMRGEIRRICREFGLTAIYVTHDQKEALSISDRMAVLMNGRLVQVGTPEEIYRRPQDQRVAEFIGETNLLPGRILQTGAPYWQVETALGIFLGLPATPDWKPSAGDTAMISIRPESWRIAADLSNRLTGAVTNSVYLGEMAQYEVASGETRLRVFELDPQLARRQPGETITLGVQPGSVVVMRE